MATLAYDAAALAAVLARSLRGPDFSAAALTNPSGYAGIVHHLAARKAESSWSDTELESRLIEMGFVEGARIEVLHEGLVGRDPIAVRVENVTIAVRRREGRSKQSA